MNAASEEPYRCPTSPVPLHPDDDLARSLQNIAYGKDDPILEDIAYGKDDPTSPALHGAPPRSPERQRDPDRDWLDDHTDLVSVNERLESLYGKDQWTDADRTYVKSLRLVFEVKDMPSFYRNQAYEWLCAHPAIRDENDFLANMYQKLQRGEVLQFKQSDSLNRGVWKFMTDYERNEARDNRVAAQSRYGKSQRAPPKRQHHDQGYYQPRPTVAGYHFEIAEAYLDYHRAAADAFAGDYYHRQQQQRPRQQQFGGGPDTGPGYKNVPPPSSYGY